MLESNDNILLTFQKDQFKIYDIKLRTTQVIHISANKKDDNLGYILAGSISHCGNYICVSDDLKGLYLFNKDESEWKIQRKCFLERRCSSIKFSYDNQYIIVADKSGYVLQLPTIFENHNPITKEEDKLRWIVMGHVSVLIDFDLHPQNKLIATADRDEKIRISFYPNCFEIYAFLLGHTKFVSQIKFSDDGIRLYSAGSDGYIIIWDLQKKKALHKHRYSQLEEKDIPIVTRMFIVKDRILLFFNNQSNVHIITIIESRANLEEIEIRTTVEEVDIHVSVQDVAIIKCGENDERFYVIGCNNNTFQFKCLQLNLLANTLTEVTDDWIEHEGLNDSPVTARINFLASLPKVPVDKTGMQVYYELKDKRLRLKGNKDLGDSGNDGDSDIE